MSYQRNFSKRIKVGVIGAGSHSYRNVLPTMNYLPVEIIAICDINEDLAKKTAKQYGNCKYYTNSKEMYEKEALDAVFICVGPRFHPLLTIEALDAGIHVWVEKPVATRSSDVQEMIEHRQEKIVVVGLKKAFMPVTEKAIEIAYSEKYGNLKTILAIYPMHIPKNGKQILDERQTVNWLANGVHPLAFLMAVGGSVGSVTTHTREDGHGILMLEYKNGVIGNFHLASGPLPMETYSLYGDNWHVNIYNNYRLELQRGYGLQYGKSTTFTPPGDDTGAIVWEAQNCLATLENKALFTQGFYSEMNYFCNCILENRRPEKGTLEFAHEMMKVYEAALMSNGKTIYIR